MSRYPAILNLGFRLFFFSATVFAVLTMLWWLLDYSFALPLPTGSLPPAWLHGHEMIYGYTAAVITGFLFTAVQNWTGVPMPCGWLLLLYWLPWFVARVLFVCAPSWQPLAVGMDILFALGSFYGVLRPVLAVKQWRQMGIVSKLALMVVGNILFLLGLYGVLPLGQYMSLYLGLFIVLAIVLTIGRRVTPFFISRGVGYPFEPKNSKWVDRLCLLSFTAFFALKLFTGWQILTAGCALATAACNLWRLAGWYTRGIWRKPLLWSMFLSFFGMIFGFVLFALQPWFMISDSLALHALALSGIGLLTLSMMGRVSLGHTGRNIHQPPKMLIIGLFALSAAFVFRVVLPWALPGQYRIWIIHAQVLWIAAFFLLLLAYCKIWWQPRADGKPG